MSIVTKQMLTEVCEQKLWTIDGSESGLTTHHPSPLRLIKIPKKRHCRGNKQVQRIINVFMV